MEDVNPFNKFLRNNNDGYDCHIFKKHKEFSFNLKFSNTYLIEYILENQLQLLTTLYKNRDFRYIEFDKVNNKHYNDYIAISKDLNLYYNNILDKVLLKYESFMTRYFHKKPNHMNLNNSLININFIRKERLYTKLKYSRSPAYDIVSGGSAALLAAFLGFLISEKYGFELVDSGDFYYLFMYFVFMSFSLKPLAHSLSHNES